MSSPLKIALLTYATKPRGSVVHTWELAQALHDLGHQVCVYALDKDGEGFERSLPCEVRLIAAQPAPVEIDGLIRQRIQEFVTALQSETARFDIYHAQDCIGANALAELRSLGLVPHLVRTVHHIEDYASPYLQHCQDRSIREPDLCLCVSDRWQQALLKQYGIVAPKVGNGINLTRFSPQPSGQEAALKQAYGLIGSPLYLTVGGIEPRKNSLRLLEAFAAVVQQFPEAQLVIVGGATLFDYQDYREAFMGQAQALGLVIGRSLILPGIVPDDVLPALYRCADAFCFPSLKEGWGLVVLEAIASGLPVLLSEQPPFTEFLGPDQAVWVDPKSSQAIAQGMLALVNQGQGAELVRSSATILPQYSWQASAQQHVRVYQSVLLEGQSLG